MSLFLMMNLFLFLEVLGYIAIALMVIQIILTCGLTALTFFDTKTDSNESSRETLV